MTEAADKPTSPRWGLLDDALAHLTNICRLPSLVAAEMLLTWLAADPPLVRHRVLKLQGRIGECTREQAEKALWQHLDVAALDLAASAVHKRTSIIVPLPDGPVPVYDQDFTAWVQVALNDIDALAGGGPSSAEAPSASPIEAKAPAPAEASEGMSKPKTAVKSVAGSVWLRAAVKRWGKPDKIGSAPTVKAAFARVLKAEMIEAYARGEVKRVFDARSNKTDVMEQRLRDYKLWPVKRSR
jgi:hypothetical protein